MMHPTDAPVSDPAFASFLQQWQAYVATLRPLVNEAHRAFVQADDVWGRLQPSSPPAPVPSAGMDLDVPPIPGTQSAAPPSSMEVDPSPSSLPPPIPSPILPLPPAPLPVTSPPSLLPASGPDERPAKRARIGPPVGAARLPASPAVPQNPRKFLGQLSRILFSNSS